MNAEVAPDTEIHPPRRRIRHVLEAALCRAGFWIAPRLPYPALVALGRFAGACAHAVAGRERRIALANLELALGATHSETDRRRIARESFRSFGRVTLETLASRRLVSDGLDRRFEFAPGSLELLRELMSRRKGLIALTFHFGNWEWLSLAWAMAGFPSTVVAQPIKNPRVEALFHANRVQAGHRLIHRRHAARHLYKSLKRGEIIGLLVDLNSSVEEGGGFYDFFGVPAMTTRVVGLLALRARAPIVCSVAYPQEDGRYRIEIGPEIPCDTAAVDEQAEMDAVTRRWLAHCEEVIRRRPEQWMWMYKRWKTRPTPEPGRFPFYSFHDPNRPEKLRMKNVE